jgi:shikimate dehydrogenase
MKEITGQTKVYGVFGYPVHHSLSPVMHNAAFEYIGFDAVYVPFEVRQENIGDALKGINSLGIKGINLTIPHKQMCIPWIKKLSEEAGYVKSVNTIDVKEDGLYGYTTDGEGFLKAIKEELNWQPKLSNVLILGSGGAARAIGFRLALSGVSSMYLVDIVRGRSEELANDIRKNIKNCNVYSIEREQIEDYIEKCNCVVQATPLGMKKQDPLPINIELLHKSLVVYDLVYNTPATPLVKQARRKKIKAATGLMMLLYQGALSFEIWTGKKAPIEVMKKALLRAIRK